MTTCNYCNGSGVIKGKSTAPCSACNATGKILADICPAYRDLQFLVVEMDTHCLRCDGIGSVQDQESQYSSA
jgi:DnaJ-class molecular chaperone